MNGMDKIFDPMERAFRAGLGRNELLIPYCLQCDRPHWYPRPICPHCGHTGTALRRARGTGTIYSLTRMQARNARPVALAYVSLDEGVTLLSKIVGDDANTAAIGQAVEAAFTETDGGLPIPVFRLSKRERQA